MERPKVIIAQNLEQELSKSISECQPDRRFVLVDETTERLCLPVVEAFNCMNDVRRIVIPAGDSYKNMESIAHVWSELQRQGATRHSLLINLGGGMVTDLGGFAASTFKRGISFINIPTTLLSMVDASVGGKTGINFGGLKNEIGVFRNADCVILDTQFLKTLDRENVLSGYAEMLKHGLISTNQHWAELLSSSLERSVLSGGSEQSRTDSVEFAALIETSVSVKQRIVLEDPTEHGLRKALNLGHTIGHAFESFALKCCPVLHGYAVAHGLVAALYMSVVAKGFPTEIMRQVVAYIRDNYGRPDITCDDYPQLLQLMQHDKKNTAGHINFTLLSAVGQPLINQQLPETDILDSLDFLREG